MMWVKVLLVLMLLLIVSLLLSAVMSLVSHREDQTLGHTTITVFSVADQAHHRR
jgi:hypothetical protein